MIGYDPSPAFHTFYYLLLSFPATNRRESLSLMVCNFFYFLFPTPSSSFYVFECGGNSTGAICWIYCSFGSNLSSFDANRENSIISCSEREAKTYFVMEKFEKNKGRVENVCVHWSGTCFRTYLFGYRKKLCFFYFPFFLQIFTLVWKFFLSSLNHPRDVF